MATSDQTMRSLGEAVRLFGPGGGVRRTLYAFEPRGLKRSVRYEVGVMRADGFFEARGGGQSWVAAFRDAEKRAALTEGGRG